MVNKLDISSYYHDLFEKKAVANIATLMPDGSPQLTPVWIDYDGEHVLVNTARGRVKDKNMRNNRNVAVLIVDPDNSYRYLSIRGKVIEITEEGADAHIDKLAKKYLGLDRYPHRGPDEVRVLVKIKPEKVFGNDPR